MYLSKTAIQSENAGRYLQTLCRHFSRKVPAKWDEEVGEVNFAMGNCHFKFNAPSNTLSLTCSADEEDKLNMVKSILEQHITMLSRREKIELIWESENNV